MKIPSHYQNILEDIRKEGLFKAERVLRSPQGVGVETQESSAVLNFCANNYLGLANHPKIVKAAQAALDSHGFGLASVRFICGTQNLHKNLELKIAEFLGQEDAILYTSCFDANGGLFETLLGPEDAVLSDALNHASIIDGIRLSKAKRFRYPNSDMDALETMLKEAAECRVRLIVTDGVFSMDGTLAKLDEIAELAERYDALFMVDDSHATGFLGSSGRGSIEACGVLDKVDIVSSTLGKAMGGGVGGFIASNKTIVELLRQRSRPYLFSNTLSPPLVAAGIAAFELVAESTALRDKLEANTRYFREGINSLGFQVQGDSHPIVPVMLGDARLAHQMADLLLKEGIYVIGFSYPVVPQNQARIRVQLSAAHEPKHLDCALAAFAKVGRYLGLIDQGV